MVEHLLPRNRTEFETAVSEATGRVDDIPAPLRQLWDADKIRLDILPWLAWAFSVDYWDASWPEEKQREAVRHAIWMHRHKGTLAGIRRHIELFGGELKHAITPPGITFMMPALTEQERDDYLARFPQLRVLPYVARATYRFAHFTSAAYGRSKAFLAGVNEPYPVGYVDDVEAWSRYLRTAVYWDRGEERTLTFRAVKSGEFVSRHTAVDYDEVILPADPAVSIHLGSFNAEVMAKSEKMFLVDDYSVAERMVRISRDASYDYRLARETYTTVKPGLDFIDVRPKFVQEVHDGQPFAIYAGTRGQHQFIGGSFLPPTISWRYLYERWYLHDPERVPDERKRSTHLAHTRLGMPAYTADVWVAIRGKHQPRYAQNFVSGFLCARSRAPLQRAVTSVEVGQAARDKVLVNSKTVRQAVAGDRLRVTSSSAIGQLVENY